MVDGRIDVEPELTPDPPKGGVRVTTPPTTGAIQAHMQVFGPIARVLLIVRDENCLNNVNFGLISGKNGLLTHYKDYFTSVDPRQQLTHVGGGTIQVETLTRVKRGRHARIHGKQYTLVVFECIPQEEIALREDAIACIRGEGMFTESKENVQQIPGA